MEGNTDGLEHECAHGGYCQACLRERGNPMARYEAAYPDHDADEEDSILRQSAAEVSDMKKATIDHFMRYDCWQGLTDDQLSVVRAEYEQAWDEYVADGMPQLSPEQMAELEADGTIVLVRQ